MATPLKEYYNDRFYDYFIDVFTEIYSAFDGKKFKKEIYSAPWAELELKERMKKSADALAAQLPDDFKKAAALVIKFTDHWHKTKRGGFGLEMLFVCDYIERYGIHDVETSIKALEKITTVSSAEFAVRPFLVEYPEKMYTQMLAWAKHEHFLVRRLASEGFRPRLPWGMALAALKKDPAPILPVLEILKNDTADTVRLSVSNNLNDISKDNPVLVLGILQRWKNGDTQRERIIRHAARTLLKQGNEDALGLFGTSDTKGLEVTPGKKLATQINRNEKLTMMAEIANTSSKEKKIRLEYAIYFLLKNGEYGKKVFQIGHKVLQGNSKISVIKSHHFKPITTRTYYTGVHKASLIVNGKEFGLGTFTLLVPEN